MLYHVGSQKIRSAAAMQNIFFHKNMTLSLVDYYAEYGWSSSNSVAIGRESQRNLVGPWLAGSL